MSQSATSTLAGLRSGAWLTREPGAHRGRAVGCDRARLFAVFVAGTHGWIVPLDRPTTTDFASFYAAGSLADAGTPQLAYDQAAHWAAEQAATAPGIEYQFFNYPPVFLLICAALAPMPYLVAFCVFMAATLLLYLAVARRILDDSSGTALLALLAFPMVYWTIGLGQNAFLTAALFGAGTLLIDRRPMLAGLCFGALCYKPHFGLLMPLALAAGGHWRAFAGAAVSALGLALISLLLFGAASWEAFFATAAGSHAVYESGRILFAGMGSPFGAVRLLGGGVALAYAVQGAASLIAAAAVVMVWSRGLSLSTRAAVLASATLVALPLLLLYDLMLGSIAALWLVRDRANPAARGWEMTALAGLVLVLLVSTPTLATQWHLPVFPLAALALFGIAVGHAWREMAQQKGTAPSLSRAKEYAG